jgi:tetratricopeptide (TPR) repeat protein
MITLVKDLLESDRWALVHHDPGYMIFVKNSDLNSELIERYRISPDDAYWLLVYKASHMLLTSPNRYLYATVGHCFEKLGEYDEAVKAYRAALESKPEDKELLDAIERVTALAGSVHMASK